MLSTTYPTGLRFRGLLLRLLLALGLLASVSMSQPRLAEQHQLVVSDSLLPAMKQLHQLSAAVGESRGLVAVHLRLRKAGGWEFRFIRRIGGRVLALEAGATQAQGKVRRASSQFDRVWSASAWQRARRPGGWKEAPMG